MYLPQFVMRRQDDDISHLLNQVHHCDAMALLRRLPDASIDMVLCDLPYQVLESEWDVIIPISPLWFELQRVVKMRSAIVLTATEPFASMLRLAAIDLFKYDWVWWKNNVTDIFRAKLKPLNTHEQILVFSKGTVANKSDKLMFYYPQDTEKINSKNKNDSIFSSGGINRRQSWGDEYTQTTTNYPRSVLFYPVERGHHPTQKPVALFEYLIRTYTQEGEIVLDMTCGSGTTGLACVKSNRQFICGDNHLPYVELARKRLQDTDPYVATELPDGSKQLSLFEGKGA